MSVSDVFYRFNVYEKRGVEIPSLSLADIEFDRLFTEAQFLQALRNAGLLS